MCEIVSRFMRILFGNISCSVFVLFIGNQFESDSSIFQYKCDNHLRLYADAIFVYLRTLWAYKYMYAISANKAKYLYVGLYRDTSRMCVCVCFGIFGLLQIMCSPSRMHTNWSSMYAFGITVQQNFLIKNASNTYRRWRNDQTQQRELQWKKMKEKTHTNNNNNDNNTGKNKSYEWCINKRVTRKGDRDDGKCRYYCCWFASDTRISIENSRVQANTRWFFGVCWLANRVVFEALE